VHRLLQKPCAQIVVIVERQQGASHSLREEPCTAAT
jgi:hypothetical protein